MTFGKEYGLYFIALVLGLLFYSCSTDPIDSKTKKIQNAMNRPKAFPQRQLHIKMETDNFTNNTPVISWDKHPDAKHGYFLLVLIEDKSRRNSDIYFNWEIVWQEYTDAVSVTVSSKKLQFVPSEDSEETTGQSVPKDIINPLDRYIQLRNAPWPIIPGDIIRIEVYVLDGSGTLDMKNRKGVLFMDVLNVIR